MDKRAERAWVIYDWANSAWATTVMTAFFPIFFKSYFSAGVEATVSTARLGVASSVAGFVIAALSPVLGSISDAGSYKKKFLATFLFLGLCMTFCLTLLAKGEWFLACIVYTLASLGFGGANAFYDSLLPSVATPERVDAVSVKGYAWGYLGGGTLFALNVLMSQKPELFGLQNSLEAVRWSFVSVVIWWAIFSIPLFLHVKEREVPATPVFENIKSGVSNLLETLRNMREYKAAMLFVLAYFCYNDGVGTTMKMAVDFGLSIGFETADLIKAILLVQFVGFPATLLFIRLARRFTPKTGIYICIGVYLFALAWGARMNASWEFYLLAAMIGLVQGGIQALSRSYFTRLFPNEKAGQFFGIYNLFSRFNGILGPLIVASCGLLFNSSRAGLLGIAILFILGAFLLSKVSHSEEKEV